jgi:hypothetical protein
MVWTAFDKDKREFGNTITLLSTSALREAAEKIYPRGLTDDRFERRRFWEPTLPCVDLQDANFLAIEPRIITNGESAVFWAGSELGATYGDGVFYIAHSFEDCLIRMFDAVALCRK